MIKNAIGICTSVRNLQHVKNPNYVLILHLLATVFGQFLAQVSQFEKRLHFWSKLIIIQDGRHPTLDKHTVKYVRDMVTSWWQTLNVSYCDQIYTVGCSIHYLEKKS